MWFDPARAMPSNVEIKARVRDFQDLLQRVRNWSQGYGKVFKQQDTFFTCPNGRLKLRQFTVSHPLKDAELIWYQRADQCDSKLSDFTVTPIRNHFSDGLLASLSNAYGVAGTVKKTRYLFMDTARHTRIHVDRVEGLGDFFELEVQMQDGQTLEQGKAIAADLMQIFDIKDGDLVAGAYVDLLVAE